MISARLYAIANQITKSNVVCDIGTDHALLPIFLIKSNKANKVYAVDINKKPLEQAKKNIKKYNVNPDSIELILSNGLEWNNEVVVNDCIISGLGGSTIKKILNNDNDRIEKYIVCPNNKEIYIREWVKNNKYFIETETLVSDNNIIYPIIVINKSYGLKIKNKKDLLFGPFLRKYNTKDYYDYWTLKYVKINNYFFSMNKKSSEYKKMKTTRKLIKKELERIK